MKTYSLKTQAAYLLLGRILAFLIVSASPIILVRIMSTDQYGTYQQVLLISVIVLILIRLRIPQSLYYFFPRTIGNHDKILSQSIFILTLTSLAGVALFWILGRFFHLLPSGIAAEYVTPVAAYIFIESIAYILDHIFILEKKPKQVLVLSGINGILRISLVVGAFLIFKSVIGIVYALILFSTVRLVVLIGYLIKKYDIKFRIFDRKLLSDQMRYIAPLAVSTLIGTVGSYMDKGVISALMPARDFAIYSIGGIGIMNAVSFLYTSIGDVCLQRFGELKIKNNLEGIRNLWHKMVIVNATITIPVLFFCFFSANQIITVLFTEKYILSVNIWRINLLILLIQMLGYGYIPRATGKTRAILTGNIVRFVVVVPLSFLLITKIGLLGGAISFVIGYWLNAIIQLYSGKNILKVKINNFLPWNKLLTILIISIFPALLLPYIAKLEMSNINTLLMGAGIYFPIITIALKFTGFININEIKTILTKN